MGIEIPRRRFNCTWDLELRLSDQMHRAGLH